MTNPQASSNKTAGAGLADAIRIAKENEKTAADFYANAAKTSRNSMAKKLFDQLTEFEKIHYERLTALEKSLSQKGVFISYAGTDFTLPPNLVIRMPELPDRPSVMKIITEAADLETRAENGYNALAEQTTDFRGTTCSSNWPRRSTSTIASSKTYTGPSTIWANGRAQHARLEPHAARAITGWLSEWGTASGSTAGGGFLSCSQ